MKSLGLPQEDAWSGNKGRRKVKAATGYPGSDEKMAIKMVCLCVT